MKRRIIAALLAIALVVSLCFCLTGCRKYSFSIQFIDVGQGDAALIQCDGHYMLIDGGSKSEGDKVYSVLAKQNIHHLDILVASHLHEDHIGGLIKALTYVSTVDLVLTNSTDENTNTYHEFEHQLGMNGLEITIPEKDRVYPLGSATVKVVSNCSEQHNDSLVLLVTYGKTKFLFTGDIEQERQNDIADQYNTPQNISEDSLCEGKYPSTVPYKIDFMKMPHHGAKVSYRFMWTFMPTYAVISVNHKKYASHPNSETIRMLECMKEEAPQKCRMKEYYRTDQNGNIFVESDGKDIRVRTDK